MAEIPVERNTKSGLPWWLIPLLLLLLVRFNFSFNRFRQRDLKNRLSIFPSVFVLPLRRASFGILHLNLF